MRKIQLSVSDKGFEYYCKGLIAQEIAILLSCSYRTVQNYMCAENWKEQRKDLRDLEKQKQKQKIIADYEKDKKPRFLGGVAFEHIED